MNMTTEKQLADALRAALETIQTVRTCAEYEAHAIVREHDSEAARDALAAYDAWPERMATDYRVTTEFDAFDTDSPRAAAVEVWQRIRESAGPVFTVRCSDGRVLDVDLSDEDDEGVEA